MTQSHNQQTPDDLRQSLLRFLLEELQDILPDRDDLTEESPLIGKNQVLKSAALVTLLVAVEDYLEEEHDVEFIWSSDAAMSQMRSWLRSVGHLADHLANTIRGV
ncbi:MAG: hypothetical protein HQL52_06000 [Magnetococcales bacterium]|nr:hypothetical protein [Magnetococcales bacterium]